MARTKREWKVFNPRNTEEGEKNGEAVYGKTAAELLDRLWRYYGIDGGRAKDVRNDIRRYGSSYRGGVRIHMVDILTIRHLGNKQVEVDR